MKRNRTSAWVLAVTALLAWGCGSDDKPDTDSTNNTGDDTESSSSSSPSSTASQPAPSPTAPDGVGDPVLEDIPPETELSELDEDQLAEVCGAYVKTSTAVNANLGDLCPVQSLFLAVQTEGVDDDESYESACSEELEACEALVDVSQAQTPEERCESASECGATIEDFNACNRQIAAMNRILLAPLANEEVSACSETSYSQASSQATLLGLQGLLGLTQVSQEEGGNPTDPDGPCQRIGDACPDLGVALGAFGELGGLLQ